MLLSLPKLQYAGVNALLLPCSKLPLFIQNPVYKITRAVKLFFLSLSNLIFSFLQTWFSQFNDDVIVKSHLSGYAEQRPLLSRVQINKRRGML